MPPRIRLRTLAQLVELSSPRSGYICRCCQYATAATTTSNASNPEQSTPNIPRYDPRLPPSHRDPKYRKSQLIRSYVSLLQSTPLIIIFQHNNIRSAEWTSIRRELYRALQKVDEQIISQSTQDTDPATLNLIGNVIKLQVINTTMFEPALRITEYYKPSPPQEPSSSALGIENIKEHPSLTHALSTAAYRAANEHRYDHPLTPILAGNIALLTFPSVSPQHLKAALQILAPSPRTFPAPTRRANPSYHEPGVQDGLKKLLLLGARVDGEVFDMEGTRWVGSIEGGIGGLRAQLVSLLQMAGVSVSQTLEAASKNLWMTMEGRRKDMEEKEGDGKAD